MRKQILYPGGKLVSFGDTTPAYQNEYLSIHNTRLEWTKVSMLWLQILYPTSIAVFVSLLTVGINNCKPVFVFFFVFFGAFVASLMILGARWNAKRVDRLILDLYPRIITLELLVDYQFYRNYLTRCFEEKKRYEKAKQFIKDYENIEANTTEELSSRSHKLFNRDYFKSASRGYGFIDLVVFGTILAYFIVATYISLYCREIVL